MTERPEDQDLQPQAEGSAAETTGVDKDAVDAQAKAEAPGVEPDDSGAPAADAGDDAPADATEAPAEDEGSDVPPAPEESPATAPDESAPPAKPAPAQRKRDQAPAAGGTPVEVRAQAKYVRTSARKARLVCDHIRGKDVSEARSILAFTPRAAAKPWSKLLESAVANAEHNHELIGDDLKVIAVYADEGPTLKRFQPRAMGRATRIRKRTSHLTIILSPKDVPAGTRRGARRKGGR